MANLNSTLINGNLRVTNDINTSNLITNNLEADSLNVSSLDVSGNTNIDGALSFKNVIKLDHDSSSASLRIRTQNRQIVMIDNARDDNTWSHVNFNTASFPYQTDRNVASEQWAQENFYSLNGGTLNGTILFNQSGNGIQFASEGSDILKICSTVNGSNSNILFYAADDDQDGFIFRLNKYQVGDIDIMDIHNTGVTIGQTKHNVPLTVNGNATFAGSSVTLKCPIIIDSGTFNNNGNVFLQITDDYGLMDAGNFSVGFKALGTGVSNLKFRFMNTSNTSFDYTFPTQTGTIALTSNLNGYATQSWVTGRGYITSSALNGYATQSWVKSSGQKYSMSFSNDTLTITENF